MQAFQTSENATAKTTIVGESLRKRTTGQVVGGRVLRPKWARGDRQLIYIQQAGARERVPATPGTPVYQYDSLSPAPVRRARQVDTHERPASHHAK